MSLAPAVEVGPQNTFLTCDPYAIADLCCKFQVSKGKTVGGDALQRPKSASKIYLVWISVGNWILFDFQPHVSANCLSHVTEGSTSDIPLQHVVKSE